MAQFPSQTNANGLWTLKKVKRNLQGGNFPTFPDAPTIGTATAGNAQASVTFTAPASNGGSLITGYTVTSSPGGFTGTGVSSPITVTGLTNGTAYTFTVRATNTQGSGPASSASNSITPLAGKTVVVQVWGGAGGPGRGGASAGGGYATATFTAAVGVPITYVVGAGGTSQTSGTGVYGGGSGGSTGAGAGGGFSAVFLGSSGLSQNSATQNRVIALAGGSGGGGNDGYGSAPGGAGGGTTGGNANDIESPNQGLGGRGGTQSAGGSTGSGGSESGSTLFGGNSFTQNCGGGGGGYFGGGTGGTNGGYDAAGGGGSGYIRATGSFTADGQTVTITSATLTGATNAQNSASAGSGATGYSSGVGTSGAGGQVRITVDGTVVINTTTYVNGLQTYTVA